MKRADDISTLLTDINFRKILSEWTDLSKEERANVYREYELAASDVDILRRLWLGLDFRRFEHSEAVVEDTLNEMIWKLAERKASLTEKSPARKLYEHFARIAAILIIPIVFYAVYVQFFRMDPAMPEAMPQLVTVSSQPGTISNLILPDGSHVWLNAGSSVSYPNHFYGHTRAVSLTGEAYFDVVKNKKMPMVVSAGEVNLKVYGTMFNVNAFSSEQFVKITLVEGSISLSSALGKFNNKDEFFVEPGQTVTFDEASKKLVVKNEDPFYYTAWKDGILVFKNNTFEMVLKRLSRRFNVDLELKDQTLASIPMDATFRNENINEILRLLSFSIPFKYDYESPRKLPDGTFVKSKIFIEKKSD